jgi:glycosyltransferase involved in cell wall biosynthesis
MLTSLLVVFFGVTVATLIASCLLTCHAWEHRRYARGRCREDLVPFTAGRVAIIVPCKGVDFSLRENLFRLLKQDYTDYEVHFVVEAADDPACQVIRKLIAEKPDVEVNLIVAGCTVDCGQKIHNLLIATERLGENIDTLVFVDSDVAPEQDWLRRLVAPLEAVNIDAVTSYRWFIPQSGRLANLLLFSINAAVMGLVCSRRQAVLWGGTWAISRDVFERAHIAKSWKCCLSDDLVASSRLDRLRLNINFEPRCVVKSPIDYRAAAMWEFLRRQCYVGRWYRVRSWLLGVLFTSFSMATFWGGLMLTPILAGLGHPRAAGSTMLVAATMWGLAILRAKWRQDAGRLFVSGQDSKLKWARKFDICCYPLVLTVVWCGLFSSAVGRMVSWRGIGYRIHKEGKVEVVGNRRATTTARAPFLLAAWSPLPAATAGHKASHQVPATISLYGDHHPLPAEPAGQRRSA